MPEVTTSYLSPYLKQKAKLQQKNKQRSVDFDINGMEIKEKGIEKYISPPLFLIYE